MLGNRHYHYLYGSYGGRKHQPVVVAVSHDDGAYQPRGDSPGGLVRRSYFILPVGKAYVKRPCKAVPEVVGGSCLERLAVMHKRLYGIGCDSAGELVALCLFTLDYRHRKLVLAEIGIDLEHSLGLGYSLLGGLVEGMALLPQKLPGAQKRPRGLFPSYNRDPLVIELGEVPVGVDYVGIVVAKQRLGGRSYAEPLLQPLASAVSHPCNLGSKALDMVLLLIKKALGYEHRHTDILMPKLFKPSVQNPLDILPYGVAVGSYYHTALYAGVLDKLSLFYYISVPLGEVDAHRSYRLHHLLVSLSHFHLSPYLTAQLPLLTLQAPLSRSWKERRDYRLRFP